MWRRSLAVRGVSQSTGDTLSRALSRCPEPYYHVSSRCIHSTCNRQIDGLLKVLIAQRLRQHVDPDEKKPARTYVDQMMSELGKSNSRDGRQSRDYRGNPPSNRPAANKRPVQDSDPRLDLLEGKIRGQRRTHELSVASSSLPESGGDQEITPKGDKLGTSSQDPQIESKSTAPGPISGVNRFSATAKTATSIADGHMARKAPHTGHKSKRDKVPVVPDRAQDDFKLKSADGRRDDSGMKPLMDEFSGELHSNKTPSPSDGDQEHAVPKPEERSTKATEPVSKTDATAGEEYVVSVEKSEHSKVPSQPNDDGHQQSQPKGHDVVRELDLWADSIIRNGPPKRIEPVSRVGWATRRPPKPKSPQKAIDDGERRKRAARLMAASPELREEIVNNKDVDTDPSLPEWRRIESTKASWMVPWMVDRLVCNLDAGEALCCEFIPDSRNPTLLIFAPVDRKVYQISFFDVSFKDAFDTPGHVSNKTTLDDIFRSPTHQLFFIDAQPAATLITGHYGRIMRGVYELPVLRQHGYFTTKMDRVEKLSEEKGGSFRQERDRLLQKYEGESLLLLLKLPAVRNGYIFDLWMRANSLKEFQLVGTQLHAARDETEERLLHAKEVLYPKLLEEARESDEKTVLHQKLLGEASNSDDTDTGRKSGKTHKKFGKTHTKR